MPQMKMSYTDIRYNFIGTDYGNVSLELAVGRERVVVKDKQGIKVTLDRRDVSTSEHPLIVACKEHEEDRFLEFCDKLEKLDDE